MTKLKTRTKIIFGVTAFLGAVTAVLPQAVYHFVEVAGMHMGMNMACYEACISATVIGAIVTVIALGGLFIKNSKASLASSGLLLAGGILTIVIPRFNGYCEMHSMACRAITEPTLLLLGTSIIVLSVSGILSGIRNIYKKA